MRKNFSERKDAKKCAAPGCEKWVRILYCLKHRRRVKAGLPLDLSIDCGAARIRAMCGSGNHQWNGGTGYHKNHREYERQRLLVLERSRGLCEICGARGKQVHHKDESRDNHDIKNLILLCVACHKLIHAKHRKSAHYFKEYGFTIGELAKKFGCCAGTISYWHKHGVLKNRLTNPKTTSTVTIEPAETQTTEKSPVNQEEVDRDKNILPW